MKVYIYNSELTERMIITKTYHGFEWTMKDGEVFELVFTYVEKENCAMISKDDFGCVTFGKEADLA